jgi:hypothetical protein
MPEYSTRDLYFAAYLVTIGIPLLRLDRVREKQVYFIFDTTEENSETLHAQWLGDQEVPARSYAHNVQALKSAIFNTPIRAASAPGADADQAPAVTKKRATVRL